ncbi:MAG: EEP domain-containing protein, partial [Agrobacterium sp.]|nr:EEP domain-containing protein [Agrobacterium sp.]
MKKNGLLNSEKTALAANSSLPAFVMQSLRDHRQRQKAVQAAKDHSFPVIASYNVHKCVGRDRKFDPDRTSRVIQEIGA